MNRDNSIKRLFSFLVLAVLIAASFTWFLTKTFGLEEKDGELIKVGDTEIDPLTGEISIYKWNREEYVKFGKQSSIKNLNKSDETYFLDTGTQKIRIYPVSKSIEDEIWLEEGGLEYEIILDKKPPTNKFTIPIEASSGIEFWYQPPLNEETWENGWTVNETVAISPDKSESHHRPPEIVGSYAIYHTSKRDDHYKTGKIGHILRPKFFDSNNNSIWGSLNYTNGQLEISVDSIWLENASYPVTIDPTIGYTSQGGSYSTHSYISSGRVQSNYWWTTNTTGVIQNVSVYCDYGISPYRLMVYWRSTQASSPVYRIASTDNFTETGTKWKTVDINDTWGNEVEDTGYYFLCLNYISTTDWYYDSGGSNKYRAYYNYLHPVNDDPPSIITWTGSGYDPGRQYSIYTSYEEAPEPGIANVTATTVFSAGAYGWVNVTASDYGGVTNLHNVTMYANNSYGQNFTLYWNQSANTFTEEDDPLGICDLSGSVYENLSSYHANIAFRFRLSSPVNETSFDATITLFNDDDLNYTETFPSLFSYVGLEWDPVGDAIDSAFSIFGILDYMATITDYVEEISEHFVDSIAGMITLIGLQFQVIWEAFSWFTDWATRIITMALDLNDAIHDVIGGVTEGSVNLWVYFNMASFIDIIPLGIILYWINSMVKRSVTQGAFTVLWNDLQTFINVFSFFMSSFMMVIGIIENAVFRLINTLLP